MAVDALASRDLSDLSAPTEDYVKAIFELERGGNAAATNALADVLRVSPGSVTGMLKRLAEQGLLQYERYYGARLTPRGRAVAVRMLRRHRVIETYLVQALGFSWDEVHQEAERLEHAASDTLIERMAKALGEPEVDPHGAPIPTRDGALTDARYPSLADVAVGATVEIVGVADEDPRLLRHLADLALTPRRTLRLIERAPFDGPLTLRVRRQTISIGPALAQRLLVRIRE